MYQLSEREAFQAMVRFLEEYEKRSGHGDLPPLLSDLEILSDGQTSDPAAWDDWMDSVRAVKARSAER